MDKRGLSPVVATLLLISFAIALGVVIMNFGQAQIEEEAECTLNIGLKFSEVSGEKQVCLDREKNQLFLIVENGINIKIDGLIVNIIGTKRALTHELADAKIEKAGAYLRYVPYNPEEVGKLRQIKIVPLVKMFDEQLICQEKAIVLEEVRECS